MGAEVWEKFAAQVRRRACDQALGEAEFARLFGISEQEIPQPCRERMAKSNFHYARLRQQERDYVLLEVLKRVDAGQLSKAGAEGKERWESGWGENFANFLNKGYDVAQLIPKYIHPDRPLRLYQDYVLAEDAAFELNWYEVFRTWLFSAYLGEYEHIYEFACGPGHNLVALARMYPQKQIYGLDWAQPSVAIANQLHDTYGFKISGMAFDFFHPDAQVQIQPNSAVMTIGGLEQTGENHGQFYDYLREQKPALVMHVEPFLEWYDENNLVDYLAIRFHNQRNYLKGYIPRLLREEKEGRVKIIKAQRGYFGSLFHDGYSLLIWKPV